MVGEEGQIWADYLTGGVALRTDGHEEVFDVSATVPTLPAVLAAWLASVKGKGPVPVTVADGLATMQVVEACYRSARLGKPVTL